MKRPRVLLTDPLHPQAHPALAAWADVACLPEGLSREASDAALRAAVPSAQGLVVRRQLPQDLFDGPHALQLVMRQGVGLDFIPVERATAWGIPVGNTPGVNANAVAEYVFAALLAHSRQIAGFDAEVRAGRWSARTAAGARTFELRGRRLGLVGYGAIGQRIAAIARLGFGMTLAATTGTPSRLPPEVQALSLPDLFAECDVIVIACPLTERTRGMVDAAVLARARPHTVLVNVGRGPVIREDALAAALQQGRLAGAVLDVFEVQPLPETSPLRQHPGVLLTPHLAGLTQQAERAMGMLVVDTLAAVLLRGERPPNIVNPEVFGAARA